MKQNPKYRWLFHGLVIVITLIPQFLLFKNIGLVFGQSRPFYWLTVLIIPFYLSNIFWLIPQFLKKRKYWQYALGFIVLISLYYLSFQVVNPINDRTLVVTSLSNERIELPMRSVPPIMSFFFMTLILGTTFEMLLDWERRGKIIEKTEKEKLSAELSFLKTQINPHFFFNTLNSIYALAATDTQSTQQAILILSNLMRYILYESNVSKIALSKEVQFLKNYIDLQQLRYTKSSSKKVAFKHHGNLSEFNIEPLLLVTFVENAFKHSHSYNRETSINVVLEARKDEALLFKVTNTVGDFSEQLEEESGIGLENVKRRLALLYPDKHQLAINRINGHYNVVLTLSK